MALRPYIACIWTRRARPSGIARVVPDGCVDLLFDLVQPKAIFVGAMTRPLLVAEDGMSRWLGVRFRPGGAFPFLRFKLGEATDASWNLAEIWSGANEWAERLARATSVEDRVVVLDAVLSRKLAFAGCPAPDPRVDYATKLLMRTGGGVAASRLSQKLDLSRQHLNRLFDQHVGLSVKAFARVSRLQVSIRLLRGALPEATGYPGAALAARAGFFDQSHLISDFKALAGVTPTQFFREELEQR